MHLKIPHSTLQSLVTDALLEDYRTTLKDIQALKDCEQENGFLASYQQEDMTYYKRLRKALKVVLHHYATQESLAGVEGLLNGP